LIVSVGRPWAVILGRWTALPIVIVILASLALLATPAPAAAAPQRHRGLEAFALELLNCTRTGGWVRADGSCRAYGTGRFSAYRAPIRLHRGISSDVAYPWAVKIARARYCGHSLAGSSIDRRYASAGYRHPLNGESVGCSGYYGARRTIIRAHRRFQAEKPWNGWHWRNMKDPDWRSVGIGVASVGDETRVVFDFYGGRAPRN
jgi:hypothetical protein